MHSANGDWKNARRRRKFLGYFEVLLKKLAWLVLYENLDTRWQDFQFPTEKSILKSRSKYANVILKFNSGTQNRYWNLKLVRKRDTGITVVRKVDTEISSWYANEYWNLIVVRKVCIEIRYVRKLDTEIWYSGSGTQTRYWNLIVVRKLDTEIW